MDAKELGEFPTGSPPTGAPNRGGVGYNRQRLTNISLKRARYRYSYYGTLIRSHMRSIEWCYFQ